MSLRRLGFYLLSTILFLLIIGIPTNSQYWSQNNNNNEVLISGRNVNMVEGTVLPDGDPWLQRQNEPSIAVSTRNPLHLLAAANDYRTVDVPFTEGPLPGTNLETSQSQGDAWIGIFKSFDGGESWITELLDGYPQLTSSSSPLHGYQAAADPVVRAGTDGLFYVCGMVFQRDPVTKEIGNTAIFVARYRDNNNKEKGDTIEYLGTEIVFLGNPGQLFDKPWMAVDIPRNGGCGNVYVVAADFVGNKDQKAHGKILFSRSTDCGQTWSNPKSLTDAGKPYQGAAIAIDPEVGTVYVALRRFEMQLGKKNILPNAIFAIKSTNFGQDFSKPVQVAEINPFDQPTTPIMFRTNCYPSMTVDDNGVVYIAWSQRGPDNKARIVISTSTNGIDWSVPTPVELTHPTNPGVDLEGHQFMPTITYANGKLMLAWYDSRYDKAGNVCWFRDHISDDPGCEWRHTIDVRIAQASPGVFPVFNPSIQVSRYIWVIFEENGKWNLVQGQWNPPNFPLFQGGTTPFHGDYIDMSASPMFVWDDAESRWRFNTEPTDAPVFHVTWTDNRDVRPPWDFPYDWTDYTPPDYSNPDFSSGESPECGGDWRPGMRNQNVYTSKISWGLEVGSTGNSKPLNIPRAFIIEVNNTTDEVRSFRLMIGDPRPGGQASFLQFGTDPIFELDVEIAPYSSISRPVFFQSSDPNLSLRVDVIEIDAPGGNPVHEGLTSFIILNPGDTEAALEDPDGWKGPPVGEEEIYDPVIELSHVWDWSDEVPELNPNIWSPNIWSPNIWSNPIVVTPNIWSPNIWSPNIWSPNIWSPNIWSPNIWSPNIWSPNIWSGAIPDGTNLENARVVDVSWKVKNGGNTTSSYTFKTFAKEMLPEGIYVQLIVYKTTYMPVTNGQNCQLEYAPQHEILANIANPNIWSPNIWSPNIWSTNIFNASIENATFSVPPGEEVNVLLRLIEEYPAVAKFMKNGKLFDLLEFAKKTGGGVTQQQVNTSDAAAGIKIPRAAATILVLGTAALPDGSVGIGYTGYVDAVGGDGNYTYSLNSGELPDGLVLSTVQTPPYPYNRGLISGDPTTAGTYYFVVQVDDGSGQTDTQSYKIAIHEGPVPVKPTITTPSPLPNAIQGYYYIAGLEASGGQLPYIWTIEPGSSLPEDLSLDEGGAINGKPVAPVGTYAFTVRVTDQDGDFYTKQFSLEIRESTGTDVTISGMVYDANNNPLDGVVIRGLPNTPITGSGGWDPGYYEDTVPAGWEGIAIPFKVGYTFDPAQRAYTSTDTVADIPNQDYNLPVPMVIISGFVNLGSGSGVGIQQSSLDGVTMSGFPGAPVVTDMIGYYQAYVPIGWLGKVTPTKDGYIFEPISKTYENVLSNQVDQNYEGVEGWISRYHNPSATNLDIGFKVATDRSGYLYVTGMTDSNPSGLENFDTITLKQDPSDGSIIWETKFDLRQDNPMDIGVFRKAGVDDHIFVAAFPYSGSYDNDFATLMYLGSTGGEDWRSIYDYAPVGHEDEVNSLAVDAWGDVYVTGMSDSDSDPNIRSWDYATIKYDGDTGAELWVARYEGANNDVPLDIIVDALGNTYVTGYSSNGVDYDIRTIKYDKNGTEVWNQTYDGTFGNDTGRALTLDPAGYIYVLAEIRSDANGDDFGVLKYDLSGNFVWATTYNNTDNNDDDIPKGIAIDGAGNIYVTGTSEGGEGDDDILTVKFIDQGPTAAFGWRAVYDGPDGNDDMAVGIVIDPHDQIYITGESRSSEDDYDYITVKYKNTGPNSFSTLWTRRYDGQYGDDSPRGIALCTFGNIYLTGESTGDGTNYDFATIKYSQFFDSLVITSTTLQDGVVDAPYAAFLDAFGSSGPRTWSITSGALPPEIALESSTGIISGTPTTEGTYNFQISVQDGALNPSRDLSITIYAAPVPTSLVFAQQPGGGAAGATWSTQPVVKVKDQYGNTLFSDNTTEITIDIDNNPPGDGILSGTTALTVSNGQAIFTDLSIDKAGVGYTLEATADSLTEDTSDPFDITAGAASKLGFIQLPACTAGEPFTQQPHVAVQDQYGNTITTDDTTLITLAIQPNPSSGALSGSTSVAVSGGVAVFTDLSIDEQGSGYTLQATSNPSYTPATSDPFDVNAKITGTIMYNEVAVTSKTSAQANIFVVDDGTGSELEGYTTEYDTGNGNFAIKNVPPGSYSITVSIDAATPQDGNPYPGDYEGYNYAIGVDAGEEVVNRDLTIQQIMHLVGPINNNTAQTWPPPYDTQVSPVFFGWDAIAEATTYQVIVSRYQSAPYSFIEQVVNTSGIPDSQASINLLANALNEHYQFELFAYNINSVRVGKFMIVYTSGYGWDYRFRVITTYSLSTFTNWTAGGSVSKNPDQISYLPGEDVDVMATPSGGGWTFSHWTGDVPSGQENNNPVTITMDSYKSLTAHFTMPIPEGEWIKRYNNDSYDNDDSAAAITVDPEGNVYVTGGSKDDGSAYTYYTIKYDTNGTKDWDARYTAPGSGGAYSYYICVDAEGNVYVTGRADQGSGNDMTTVKYNNAGTELWVATYNGPGGGSDSATGLVVDSWGNVYVTGRSMGSGGNFDYTTIKYDHDGNPLWNTSGDGAVRYDNGYEDLAYDMAIDSSSVYVTGQSYSGSGLSTQDYATVKYDIYTGEKQWASRYNGPANSEDYAEEIGVDASGNVYVTGRSVGTGTASDYATIKYTSGGAEEWVRRYNGSQSIGDVAKAMVVAPSGNVYVSGIGNFGPNQDFVTIKYNTAGDEIWVASYEGPNNYDDPNDIAIDSSGNVYVVGESAGIGTSMDYATVKYNSAGNEVWVRRYNGTGNGGDIGSRIVVDTSGNVYVTGTSPGSGTNSDYATIKYHPDGPPITTVAGNGTYGYNGDNIPATTAQISFPKGIAVDTAGNIYIADCSNYRVRKVDTSGIITTYAGTGESGFSGDEGPATAAKLNGVQHTALDSDGNLFIADSLNHRVRKVDTSGIITTVAGNGGFGFSGDGGPATDASFKYPFGVAIDSSGNIYISDWDDHRIRKVDGSGIITTFAGNGTAGFSGDGGPATDASLNSPRGLFADNAGNVFVADYMNNRIRKVNTSGVITTIAGNGVYDYSGNEGPALNASFRRPAGVFVDSAGNIFIADTHNNQIRRVDHATGIIIAFAGLGVGTGYSGDGVPAVNTLLWWPQQLAQDNNGNIYFCEEQNHRVRKVGNN